VARVVGTGEPLVSIAANRRLVYRTYANQGQTNAENIVPDFSFAGYRGGGVPIPTARVVAEVSPTSGDNREHIQAAIDWVEANIPRGPDGLRGAVLLRRGIYEVTAPGLVISASGVVLRGEGQGKHGTVIVATSRIDYPLIEMRGRGKPYYSAQGSTTSIASPFVPVGATQLEVTDASAFAPGDLIYVRRTPNQLWVDDLEMGDFEPDDTPWTPGAYVVDSIRRIRAIHETRVFFDIPIMDTIEARYGSGTVTKVTKGEDFIEQSGVEALRLVSRYRDSNDERHSGVGVVLSRARNSWVRRVTALHFSFGAVTVRADSEFNTIEETAHLDPISAMRGGRRYPFFIASGTGNLFQRCYTRNARHSFVTGKAVPGPNVWLDCVAEKAHADDGPHMRWSTGILFDNVDTDTLHVQNRRGSGTGHGWAGAQVMFWNCRARSFISDAPNGAMNWVVGSEGKKSEGAFAPSDPFGWWESLGRPRAARSLYLEQLRDRLGQEAVNAVTIRAQRDDRIWQALKTWAGEGQLADDASEEKP
jgi:hypothetical protein